MNVRQIRKSLTYALVLVVGLVAGCEDINLTYKNTSGTQTVVGLSAVIMVGGAGETFPAISSWYMNRVPTIKPQGEDTFVLTWEVSIPPGGDFHVGGSFQNGSPKVTFVEWLPECQAPLAPGPGCAVAGLTIDFRLDPGLGMVVDVLNAQGAPGPITINQFEWAESPNRLPLDDLIFGHPSIEALSWHNSGLTTPLVLNPGSAPFVVDIPDEQVTQSIGLIRSTVTTLAPASTQEGVYQISLQNSGVPALSTTALVILVVGLGLAGIILQQRRRTA